MRIRLPGAIATVLLLATTATASEPDAKEKAIRETALDFQRSIRAGGQRSGVGQFVQQPSFSRLSVGTSVSVPDGGTALLGNVNSGSSGSNRSGPPIASKLPGASRPFTNGSLGHKSSGNQSSVHVRIIILSEEEERQTGYSSRERR
jgi:hypothetical protein